MIGGSIDQRVTKPVICSMLFLGPLTVASLFSPTLACLFNQQTF